MDGRMSKTSQIARDRTHAYLVAQFSGLVGICAAGQSSSGTDRVVRARALGKICSRKTLWLKF
jgi:hypothetical protein